MTGMSHERDEETAKANEEKAELKASIGMCHPRSARPLLSNSLWDGDVSE